MTKYERDAMIAAQAELQIVMNLFATIRPKVGQRISQEARNKAMQITDLLQDYQNEIRRVTPPKETP